MHGVLAAPVPLDDAHQHEDEQQQKNGQHHADEPTAGGNVVGLLPDHA